MSPLGDEGDRLPGEAVQMIMAGKQAHDAVLRRFANVGQRMVRVDCELTLHVIEEQPFAQMIAFEQLRIRAVQPPRDLSECGLVESLSTLDRRVLTCPRAPAQDCVELDICWLGQRLREVDKTGDASSVDDDVGSVQVSMDENGCVSGEQRQPLLDPIGDVGE